MMKKKKILRLWGTLILNYNTLGKTIPNQNRFWEITILKHNAIWENNS